MSGCWWKSRLTPPAPPLCLCSSPLLSLLFLASPSLSSAFISRLSSRSSISYRLPTNPCARARSLSPQRRGETSGERERESRRSAHTPYIHPCIHPSIHPSLSRKEITFLCLPPHLFSTDCSSLAEPGRMRHGTGVRTCAPLS